MADTTDTCYRHFTQISTPPHLGWVVFGHPKPRCVSQSRACPREKSATNAGSGLKNRVECFVQIPNPVSYKCTKCHLLLVVGAVNSTEKNCFVWKTEMTPLRLIVWSSSSSNKLTRQPGQKSILIVKCFMRPAKASLKPDK